MKYHVASRGRGSLLTLASQQGGGGHVKIVTIKSLFFFTIK